MLFSAVLFSAVEKAFGPVCSQAAVSWDVALWQLNGIGKAAPDVCFGVQMGNRRGLWIAEDFGCCASG